jgi:hypothetical protein
MVTQHKIKKEQPSTVVFRISLYWFVTETHVPLSLLLFLCNQLSLFLTSEQFVG